MNNNDPKQPSSLDVPGTQALSNQFDTDIDNYSTAELFDILGFTDDVNPDDIKSVTQNYYEKYLPVDRDVANFFMAIQTRLLTYVAELDITSKQYAADDADRPTPSGNADGEGYDGSQEGDMQDQMDQFKEGKMTNMAYADSNQKLDAYEDKLRGQNLEGHETVIQNFVQSTDLNPWLNSQSNITTPPGMANITEGGVRTRNASAEQKTEKVFDADVKQGKLNPNMKNVVQRLVNIDSSYRHPLTVGNLGTDDYTFTLSETLTSVLSLTLYTLEIPYTWYAFTFEKGMTGLGISTLTSTGDAYPIGGTDSGKLILEGNYTGGGLLKAVENAINDFITEMIAAVTVTEFLGIGPWFELQQNALTGKTEIRALPCTGTGCTDGFYPYLLQITWFDVTFETTALDHATLNSNLGWALGFRTPRTTLFPVTSSTTDFLACPASTSLLDTNGTKYIIIKLNDYKQNRLNKGLVAIDSSENTKISLPSYVNADTQRSRFTINSDIVTVVGGGPRLLTAKQLYTVNAISQRNALSAVRLRGSSPDDTDIFAKLPMKNNIAWNTYSDSEGTKIINDAPATLIVDFSGPLQNNVREYFGPVDITTMKVTLYDDKGNLLGLNGMDWSFTLIAKCLYQY